jgi:hypothetical protein
VLNSGINSAFAVEEFFIAGACIMRGVVRGRFIMMSKPLTTPT